MISKNEQYETLKPGLYLVSTPIGNLDDITFRAIKILEKVDFLLAEDTRKTKQLYNFLGIKYPKQGIFSFNEHNEAESLPKILKEITDNSIVGYVCDAGTPSISDPGMNLVNEFRNINMPVTPIPGVSALTTAMSVCGFKFDQKKPITFWGFIPSKKIARISFLKKLKLNGGIAVTFETPHRAHVSLIDCLDILGGNSSLFVARELTKKFETLWWGSISEYISYREDKIINNSNALSGEYVFIFDLNIDIEKDISFKQIFPWIDILSPHMKPSELASVLSKKFDVQKKLIYKKIIER